LHFPFSPAGVKSGDKNVNSPNFVAAFLSTQPIQNINKASSTVGLFGFKNDICIFFQQKTTTPNIQ
jgi:hypothetical protein